MLDKPLDTIIKDDIDALAAAAVPERRTLDYKQELPGGSEGARKEFLGDIASFANAAGGDILYGVRDVRDENNRPTGTPELLGLADFNADREKLRLDQMIRNGIAPRVPGVAFHVVVGFPRGPILVVRVPRSWLALHMVTFQEHSRFYTRNAAGRYVMDVQEIRAGFLMTEALPERVRRFRDERLARLIAGETPVVLEPDEPRVVFHLIPASAFAAPVAVDVHAMHNKLIGLIPMSTSGGFNERYSLDGYVAHSGGSEPLGSYTIGMRNGAVEAVDVGHFRRNQRGQWFFVTSIEREVIGATERYLSVMKVIGVTGPIFLCLSLVGVRGALLYDRPGATDEVRRPIDREVVQLPELIVEEPVEEASRLLRPIFDMLWQCGGFPRSFNYTEDGAWQPRAG